MDEAMDRHDTNFGQFLRDPSGWGGLVLFNELDFLFQTQETGANRKEPLAFLRYAEYFTGIIILTTNLGRTIDPAVISRAHIHITFPAFTKTMRIQVWQKSVERLSGDVGTLDETAIDHLASWKINGREIKNILNLSMTWCRKEKRQLSIGVVGNPITTICPGARKEDGTQIGTGEAMLNGSTIDEFSLLDI